MYMLVCVTGAQDEPDTVSPTYVAPSVKRKLMQVFSFDDGMMTRSEQHPHHHYQQQQQQAAAGYEDDGARTTRL